jgi:hypothetical protein
VESGKFGHVRQIANLRLKVHKCHRVAAVELALRRGRRSGIHARLVLGGRAIGHRGWPRALPRDVILKLAMAQ